VQRLIGILSSFFSTPILASFLCCFHSTDVLTVELSVKLSLFTADDGQDVFVAVILKFLAWNLYIGPKINHEKCLGGQLHLTNNCYKSFLNILSSAHLSKKNSNTEVYKIICIVFYGCEK
jgi:hypothetical protein